MEAPARKDWQWSSRTKTGALAELPAGGHISSSATVSISSIPSSKKGFARPAGWFQAAPARDLSNLLLVHTFCRQRGSQADERE
jgi:hypothetical protein